ncbi:MAG TPA: aminodeoxychorismate synthase component I [Desulfotomaculum sp.]|nr:MAG: Para-aminobenzoate synthase, subunit I [Desulfotomaculum sp. 46_80]HAG12067.1 aminodeoxychorismate synthase component I [Desulfotomaculum sp.]HBY04982.1 aminodeoxychorismate synthase component I [Desulfotomaculum sp.]
MIYIPLIERRKLAADFISLYEHLIRLPNSFLLESSLMIDGIGRYSFLGADPFLIFRSKNHCIQLISNQKCVTLSGNPFSKLKELLNTYRIEESNLQFPFCGGAAGFFSYDLGRILEKLPSLADDDLNLPDMCLGFYDLIIMMDHFTQEVYIISTGLPETDPDRAYKHAEKRLRDICNVPIKYLPQMDECPEKRMKGISSGRRLTWDTVFGAYKPGNTDANKMSCHFDKDSYCKNVQKAKEYIRKGDLYQVNLSQRFSLPLTMEPWTLYRRLRSINPAPMAAYLNFGSIQVISASPERFLKVAGRQVETRPIKGTRPRGKDISMDQCLRDELWNSKKDRAELVMIIDLERNDLGRVCEIGSVQPQELFRLDEYATVFHLSSIITGKLPEDKNVVDLLRAAFPGGSITGAPKIRAMEIIEELEPVKRGIYTGAIGYLSFNGNADLNIAIRTIIIKDGQAYFQTGGGIVADSDPLAEYRETLDKALALMVALGLGGKPGHERL